MKTKTILSLILSLSIIFTSCQKDNIKVVPSTRVTTANFSVSNISRLEVSDIFKVYVSFSETEESVQLEASENIHQLVEMSQTGNKLSIGIRENTNISGSPVLNVYIKTTSLSKVKAEGASYVEFVNILETSLLDLEIIGAAKVSGSIVVDKLLANLLGAAVMDISGSSNSFDIDAEGASKMMGFDFTTNSLRTNLSGGSDISLMVNQSLDVTASGASKVYYKGNGHINRQDLSDASQIIKVN